MTEYVVNTTPFAMTTQISGSTLAFKDPAGQTISADTLVFLLDNNQTATLRVHDVSSTIPMSPTPSGWSRPTGATYIELSVVAPIEQAQAHVLRADDGTQEGKIRTMHVKTKPTGTLPGDGP
jgi:hypothetical protein